MLIDDFSDDGTWDWMNEIFKKDNNVKIMRTITPVRTQHYMIS